MSMESKLTSALITANPVNLMIIFLGSIIAVVLLMLFLPKMLVKLGVKVKLSKNGIELSPEDIKNIELKTYNQVHEIQRKQIQFVNSFLHTIRNSANEYINSKGYRYSDFPVPLIVELVKDEIFNWIIFNSIEDTKEYISLHQEMLWNEYQNAIWSATRGLDNVNIFYKGEYISRSQCKLDFKSDFFKRICDEGTENLVFNLVRIREMHLRASDKLLDIESKVRD